MEDNPMLVSFAMIPLDKGPHFSECVAGILKIVRESGLPHELNAMSTIVEGEWDEIFDLINRCRLELRKESERVSIKIWVDDRAGTTDMLTSKPKSVMDKL